MFPACLSWGWFDLSYLTAITSEILCQDGWLVSNQRSKLKGWILGHFSSGKSGTLFCKAANLEAATKSLTCNAFRCSSSVHLKVDGMRQPAKWSRTNAWCVYGELSSIGWFLSPLGILESYLILSSFIYFSIKQSVVHPSLVTNFPLLLLHPSTGLNARGPSHCVSAQLAPQKPGES